jgi:hypothetical protein
VTLEPDDRTRPSVGVVVTLRDLGDGHSCVSLDDVRSGDHRRETSWTFETFYTHKRLDSKQTDDMELSDDEYRDLGIALMARLLALTGRVK